MNQYYEDDQMRIEALKEEIKALEEKSKEEDKANAKLVYDLLPADLKVEVNSWQLFDWGYRKVIYKIGNSALNIEYDAKNDKFEFDFAMYCGRYEEVKQDKERQLAILAWYHDNRSTIHNTIKFWQRMTAHLELKQAEERIDKAIQEAEEHIEQSIDEVAPRIKLREGTVLVDNFGRKATITKLGNKYAYLSGTYSNYKEDIDYLANQIRYGKRYQILAE